jgi:hypothetical protein
MRGLQLVAISNRAPNNIFSLPPKKANTTESVPLASDQHIDQRPKDMELELYFIHFMSEQLGLIMNVRMEERSKESTQFLFFLSSFLSLLPALIHSFTHSYSHSTRPLSHSAQ